jgi:hypothetical protein
LALAASFVVFIACVFTPLGSPRAMSFDASPVCVGVGANSLRLSAPVLKPAEFTNRGNHAAMPSSRCDESVRPRLNPNPEPL